MQVAANGIALEVDDRGPPDGEPLVLVMGLGMQLTAWPEEFVQQLVERGFRVVRFDNRDAGLSQGFDALGVPNLAIAGIRYALHLPSRSPYRLADMAADTLGVMDALGLASVHLCGASMGGMIAQHIAARRPERVRSLTLMMTTSGARGLPQPTLRARQALLARPADNSRAAIVAHLERVMQRIGSPGYPPDPALMHRRFEEAVDRAWRPAGTARQIAAVIADGDRTPMLGAIRAPTRVLHGRADPLVPPAAAHDLGVKIRGAEVEILDGMGHDLPAPLLPRFAEAIATNSRRA